MPDIRYDEHGRAIPVPNLADAARSFDGNWDADLRALDTEQRGGAPVSMREWLIQPGDDAASSNSKLEGLQEFSGSFEGRWAGTVDPLQEALAAPRTPTTVNFEALIEERRRLRAALRWFGLPVATHTITTAPIKSTGSTPKIVCLIGSTKFMEAIHAVAQRLTLDGEIVLAPFIVTSEQVVEIDADTKAMLNELHLRKIDLADYVVIVTRDGYIGEATRNEIAYCKEIGKTVKTVEAMPVEATA